MDDDQELHHVEPDVVLADNVDPIDLAEKLSQPGEPADAEVEDQEQRR